MRMQYGTLDSEAGLPGSVIMGQDFAWWTWPSRWSHEADSVIVRYARLQRAIESRTLFDEVHGDLTVRSGGESLADEIEGGWTL